MGSEIASALFSALYAVISIVVAAHILDGAHLLTFVILVAIVFTVFVAVHNLIAKVFPILPRISLGAMVGLPGFW